MKIGDQVFRPVLDTAATLSIVARRLLKTFKKTKTVAIRVGDGRTIHSFGGVDVTICLGDETVTQHCRVLDTDAFDIVIGSATPKASNAGPQGRTLWGRCWVPTPAAAAPGTHGSRSPGFPLQRTGGRGRDSA